MFVILIGAVTELTCITLIMTMSVTTVWLNEEQKGVH